MYLFFNERSLAYANLLRSMLTSFQILLGKFEIGPLLEGNPLFGSILFMSYNVVIVLLLMNTFISIICESFEAVREELVGKPNDFEVFEWMQEKLLRLKSFVIMPKQGKIGLDGGKMDESERSKNDECMHEQMQMHMALSQRVDGLINVCGVVS